MKFTKALSAIIFLIEYARLSWEQILKIDSKIKRKIIFRGLVLDRSIPEWDWGIVNSYVKVTARGRPSGTATTTIVTWTALYLVSRRSKIKKKQKNLEVQKQSKKYTYCNSKNFDNSIYCTTDTSLASNKFNISSYIFRVARKVSAFPK